MRAIRSILILVLLTTAHRTPAQHIFPEHYEGCIIDQFALESDTTTAKHDRDAFLRILKEELGEGRMAQLRGILKLQIIVDLDGSSCLLSAENSTGTKSRKLGIKEMVDSKVKWDPPEKKVAALVILEFTERGMEYRRLGMNGKKGWHNLD